MIGGMGAIWRRLGLLLAILAAIDLSCAVGRPARSVLLIGVDGADPVILGRLIGEGRLPNFARLKASGAMGRLRSREPLLRVGG